ncbi:MAG: hypothetical protein Q7S79_01435 [bacterium]|nr:hypothetical protein [bacterium]
MQQVDIKAFQEALEAAKSVLVLLPQNPDIDAVAAALSLKLALSQGRDVTVASASPMTVEFNRLVGVDSVTDNPGNKNLVIEFDKVASPGVDRVTWESGDNLKLIVIPKPGLPAPSKEQIKFNYAGVAADLVVVVKSPDRNSLGALSQNQEIFSETVKVALLSNSPVQGFTNAVEVIDPSVSSASEVVYELLESMAVQLNSDIATNLLQGLRSGSNNFQIVTAKTFAVAARLVEMGGSTAQAPSGGPMFDQGQTQGQVQEPPQDWLEPKVLKGTSIS